MKKASQILLLVGAILSFVLAGCWFLYGLAFVLSGALGTEKLYEYIATLGIDLNEYVPAEIAATVIIVSGVMLMLWTGVAIASGVVGLLGRKKQNKVFYILNIVFGLLSGAEVNAVGGVFGLFTLPKREE